MTLKTAYGFALLMAATASASAFAQSDSAASEQTKNGTIIWHAPRNGASTGTAPKGGDTIIWDDAKDAKPAQAAGAAAGTPDKNGIIWDDPKAAKPVQSATAPSQGASPGASSSSVPSSAVPDRNGIIWNDPPGKTKNQGVNNPATQDRTAALPVPPSTSTLPPPQANGAGPCREFESDVTIEGQRQQMRGTACRQPDGRWRVISQVPR